MFWGGAQGVGIVVIAIEVLTLYGGPIIVRFTARSLSALLPHD